MEKEYCFYQLFIQRQNRSKIFVRLYGEQGNRMLDGARDINIGSDYAQSIIEALENSSVFVLILSKASNESSHVKNEIERAFYHKLLIMPFRIENITPNRSLEYFLSTTHWLDAYDEKAENYFEILYNNCYSILNKSDVKKRTTGQQGSTVITKRKKSRSVYFEWGHFYLFVLLYLL